jgi:hypothetical protein
MANTKPSAEILRLSEPISKLPNTSQLSVNNDIAQKNIETVRERGCRLGSLLRKSGPAAAVNCRSIL